MNLRLLQIEDSEGDAAMIVRVLEKSGHEIFSRRVEGPVELREALEAAAWDAIIADYNLPGFDAPAALKIVREMGRDTPFLVVSGVIGEEVAVGMMKAGAHDYLMKDHLARLGPAVEREVREFRHRQKLARQRQVLETQSRLLNLSRDAIITANASRVIQTWNIGAEATYGWTEDEAKGEAVHRLLETRAALSTNEIDTVLRQIGRWEGEMVHTRRDGRRITVESRQVLVRDPQGTPTGILEINRDITERRRMEERLRESQKAETLGVLASGLAHNFNNLLTVVLGNANLALQETGPHKRVRDLLRNAIEAAESAAELTSQMFAYAGKGAVAALPVSVSDVARSTVQMVQASVPKNLEFRIELESDLPPLLTDPRQLQQVLTNILLNAAESVDPEKGGTVTVRTASNGQHVRIEICDTGCGMDAQTQRRIFDPFFTTKEFGRGLGLSAAQGIVKSLGGEIEIESTVGAGSRMTVVLPHSPPGDKLLNRIPGA